MTPHFYRTVKAAPQMIIIHKSSSIEFNVFNGNAVRLTFCYPLVRTQSPDGLSIWLAAHVAILPGEILPQRSPTDARDLDAERRSFAYQCIDHSYQIQQNDIHFEFPSHHDFQMLNKPNNCRACVCKSQGYSSPMLCRSCNHSHIFIVEFSIRNYRKTNHPREICDLYPSAGKPCMRLLISRRK